LNIPPHLKRVATQPALLNINVRKLVNSNEIYHIISSRSAQNDHFKQSKSTLFASLSSFKVFTYRQHIRVKLISLRTAMLEVNPIHTFSIIIIIVINLFINQYN